MEKEVMIINNDGKNIPMPQGVLEQKVKKPDVSNLTHAKKNSSAVKQKQIKTKEPLLVEKYMNRTVHLEIDPEFHNVIAKVVDKGNGEVIKQIPPEELVELAKKIKCRTGALLDKEA